MRKQITVEKNVNGIDTVVTINVNFDNYDTARKALADAYAEAYRKLIPEAGSPPQMETRTY